MDFNNINHIIDTDDHGIDPIVYLASQFCLPSDVFEDIPAGIRYSVAKELVTSEEAISNTKQLELQDNEKVDGIFVKKRHAYYKKELLKRKTVTADILRYLIILQMPRTLVIQKEPNFVETSRYLIKFTRHFYI